jgi:two-component system, NarL family, sensor histidine kinase DesK
MESSPAASLVIRWWRTPRMMRSVTHPAVAALRRIARPLPASGSVEQVATLAALGFPIAMAGIGLARATLYPAEWATPPLPWAVAAVYAIGLPLHLRHVWFALRGERPPAAILTLAALGLLTFAGGLMHPPLAPALMPFLLVSILIVVRWWAAALLYVAVFVLVQFVMAPTRTPSYSILSSLWASAILFIPVWLAAAVATLHTSRATLRDQAVVREKFRIEHELREQLTPTLERIVDRGATANGAMKQDLAASMSEVEGLIAESRDALAEARRLVAGYRQSSLRAELQAGLAILGAAGMVPRVVLGNEQVLASTDEPARRALRSAIATMLGSERDSWVVELTSDPGGEVRVRIESEQVLLAQSRGG